MAKYTTELRTICESYAGYEDGQGYGNVNTVVSKALPKLFDFDFPIYDEDYRTVLETKIIKHFYTREICAETVGRWKLFLDERLNLIMPYYNQRYKSTLLDFNPLYDVDLTTDHSKDNSGNSANTGSHENNVKNDRTFGRTDKYERNLGQTDEHNRNLGENTDYQRNLADSETTNENNDDWTYNNDTPQGGINGLQSGNYLTSAVHNTTNDKSNVNGTETGTTNTKVTQTGNESTTTSLTGNDNRSINDTDNTNRSDTGNTSANANYTDTESYLEHVKGKSGGQSFSKMLNEYRQTFINIDNEIINNLDDLFMQIW